MSTHPDPRARPEGGALMGLYITAHDDLVLRDQAAVCKSKAILKIEGTKSRLRSQKHRWREFYQWQKGKQQPNMNTCYQSVIVKSLFNRGVRVAACRRGLCIFERDCAVRGPERPLNTSGIEEDASFAQQDLKIYDRRGKTEVEEKTEHSLCNVVCVNNCKCTWTNHTPPSSSSQPCWNTRGVISLALMSMWGHSEGWPQASAQWVLRSKQAWLLIFFSVTVRSDTKWPKASSSDTTD